jgi:integrase
MINDMRKPPYLWQHPETGYYYVVFYDGLLSERKRRESLKTKDLNTARDRLYLWQDKRYKEEVLGTREVGLPLGQAVDEYLALYAKRNKPASVHRYRNALDNVLDFVGDTLLVGSLTVKDLADYQLHRVIEADKRTVDYEIDVMRAFLNWCRKRNWVRGNIASTEYLERLVKDSASQDEKRIFTDEELKVLLEPQEGRYWQLCFVFNTLYYTGMRIGELGHLTVKDLDLRKREIQIREKTVRVPIWSRKENRNMVREVKWSPKSHEKRIVPIEARLEPLLRQFMERRTDNIYGLLFLSERGNQVTDHVSREIHKLTGKKDVSVHNLRHAHISHALNRWGRHPSVVQRWVGHKDLKTTMQYLHVSLEDLHREAGKTGEAVSP